MSKTQVNVANPAFYLLMTTQNVQKHKDPFAGAFATKQNHELSEKKDVFTTSALLIDC